MKRSACIHASSCVRKHQHGISHRSHIHLARAHIHIHSPFTCREAPHPLQLAHPTENNMKKTKQSSKVYCFQRCRQNFYDYFAQTLYFHQRVCCYTDPCIRKSNQSWLFIHTSSSHLCVRMHQLRRLAISRLVRASHINEGDEYAKTFRTGSCWHVPWALI